MKTCLKSCGKRLKRFWADAVFWMIGKVVKDVAIVYATLIIKGLKTFAQVPEKLKAQVKEILNALECAEMGE